MSVIKAMGLSGTQINGKALLDRLPAMESAELVDSLGGLMALDYVLCDMERLRTGDDLRDANFSVNTRHAS